MIKRIIYKKIVDGDLSKFIAQSNITPSGGGARDLRFSPSNKFFPVFERMFNADESDNLVGFFYWDDEPPTRVVISKPTSARPNECRITTIHKCFPQSKIPSNSSDCILLLIQDEDGRVHPHFTSMLSLMSGVWHTKVAGPIVAGLNADRPKNSTPMGFIDFEFNEEYTNDRR